MDLVYKINQIVLNEEKNQFGICYNNGIKTYNCEDFKDLYSSDSIGTISLITIIHELNIVAFVGSESNEFFNNKKIVIYDLINKKDIYSTRFQKEILSLKSINKFLILGFENELKVFSLEKKDNLIPVKEIEIPDIKFYELYDKSTNDLVPLITIYLVYFFNKRLYIKSYIGNNWDIAKEDERKIATSKIQNIFYIDKINQLLLPDETAYYIYGIDPNDGSQKLCLFRGKNPGFITSITLLNKKYLAVNNLNRTIHIFDIGDNSNNINITNLIGGLIYGDYLSPIMRISYEKIIKKKEGEFYESDFMKKGAILKSDYDGIELKVIAYNGLAYKIRINFLKKEFEIIDRKKFAQYKNTGNDEKVIGEEEKDIYNYNSIFDKNKDKKDKKEEKFVVFE